MKLELGNPKVDNKTGIKEIVIPTEMLQNVKTGMDHLDMLFCGDGVTPSTVCLLTGVPGAGKSTLGLQLCNAASGQGHVVLYNTGEEAFFQVKKTYNRLKLSNDFLLGDHQDVDELLARCKSIQADFPNQQMFLVLDSIQILSCLPEPGHKGRLPGKDSQIRDAVQKICSWAKETFSIAILIGQVTKDGEFAGKEALKHMIDAHLHLCINTDRRDIGSYGKRIAEMQKNRFGPAGLYYPFELGFNGIIFNVVTRGL